MKEYERVKTLVNKEGFMIKSIIPAGSMGVIVDIHQTERGMKSKYGMGQVIPWTLWLIGTMRLR